MELNADCFDLLSGYINNIPKYWRKCPHKYPCKQNYSCAFLSASICLLQKVWRDHFKWCTSSYWEIVFFLSFSSVIFFFPELKLISCPCNSVILLGLFFSPYWDSTFLDVKRLLGLTSHVSAEMKTAHESWCKYFGKDTYWKSFC